MEKIQYVWDLGKVTTSGKYSFKLVICSFVEMVIGHIVGREPYTTEDAGMNKMEMVLPS